MSTTDLLDVRDDAVQSRMSRIENNKQRDDESNDPAEVHHLLGFLLLPKATELLGSVLPDLGLRRVLLLLEPGLVRLGLVVTLQKLAGGNLGLDRGREIDHAITRLLGPQRRSRFGEDLDGLLQLGPTATELEGIGLVMNRLRFEEDGCPTTSTGGDRLIEQENLGQGPTADVDALLEDAFVDGGDKVNGSSSNSSIAPVGIVGGVVVASTHSSSLSSSGSTIGTADGTERTHGRLIGRWRWVDTLTLGFEHCWHVCEQWRIAEMKDRMRMRTSTTTVVVCCGRPESS